MLLVPLGELLDGGLDGLIATNTTISREPVLGKPYAKQAGGLSGKPVTKQASAINPLLGDSACAIDLCCTLKKALPKSVTEHAVAR